MLALTLTLSHFHFTLPLQLPLMFPLLLLLFLLVLLRHVLLDGQSRLKIQGWLTTLVKTRHRCRAC